MAAGRSTAQTSSTILSELSDSKKDTKQDNTKTQLSSLPAQIIYAVVDAKVVTNYQVKVLEFGRGVGSGFTGYDAIHKESMSNLATKKINELTKCPVLYNKKIFPELHAISATKDLNPEELSEYKRAYGGVPYDFQGTDVLMIDSSPLWLMVARDKIAMHEMFTKANALSYRPSSQIYPLSYTTDLAKRIQYTIPGTKYVLKLPHTSHGEGVLVVPKDELDITLNFLLTNEEKRTENYRKKLSCKSSKQLEKDIQYAEKWRSLSVHSERFLIEEYCASLELTISGKKYDPTMRIAFLISVDKNVMKFSPLDCYWKLPEKPLNQGDLRDYSISHITETNANSHKVNKKDKTKIFKQLESVMLNFFNVILRISTADLMNTFQLKNNRLLLGYVQALAERYRYQEALVVLDGIKLYVNSVKDLNPLLYIAYYMSLGDIHFYQNNWQGAIDTFTLVINHQEKHKKINYMSYQIRSVAYLKIGNDEKHRADNLMAENQTKNLTKLRESTQSILEKLEKNKAIQNIAMKGKEKPVDAKSGTLPPDGNKEKSDLDIFLEQAIKGSRKFKLHPDAVAMIEESQQSTTQITHKASK